jgi:SAM-dependent methyltransferase
MSIEAAIDNPLALDSSCVWVLRDKLEFNYSDGAKAERYIERIINAAEDLGSDSRELEAGIRDWPSEYHLSSKRAQLLSGFTFDRSLRVLEVGCGCGAITRYLGETFDNVISVEGSIRRARIARQRTRDLDNVEIVCAPFQELRFLKPFDVIFCIGVLEYAAAFMDDVAPHDRMLQQFSEILTADGTLFVAIENQFGIKYFNATKEDHLGVAYEGLEGYHRRSAGVRTFGKIELDRKLRNHFRSTCFYYPFPDYKMPSCVLAETLVASGDAAEIISQIRSRNYAGAANPLWDEASVVMELGRNGALDFFSNSFLVAAGKSASPRFSFDQLAILFSTNRRQEFSTISRVITDGDGSIVVSKRLASGRIKAESMDLILRETESPWQSAYSLFTRVLLRSRSANAEIEKIFEPCISWVEHLRKISYSEKGVAVLDGKHVDCTWSNVYPVADGFRIVDLEWEWKLPIRVNVLVIRSIHDFLIRVEDTPGLSQKLRARSGKALIRKIARALSVELRDEDFDEFVRLESSFWSLAFPVQKRRQAIFLRWFLTDRATLGLFNDGANAARRIISLLKLRLRLA